jgi:hypothetical protein
VPCRSTPKRFGIDVFENGVQDSPLIPMDPPAGPGYVLELGDRLVIELRVGCTRKFCRTVARRGRVTVSESRACTRQWKICQTSRGTCNGCCGLNCQPISDIGLRAEDTLVISKVNLLVGRSLNGILRPGNVVVGPEKAIDGGVHWQNLFASAIASIVFIALRY